MSFYEQYQYVLTVVCLVALVAILAVPTFATVSRVWDRLWSGFLRLDGFGRPVVLLGFCLAVLFGGSKGFWRHSVNASADTGIGLAGVYTATSNEVVTVGGTVTTNRIPMVGVFWTSGTVTTNLPVSVRQSNTNDWTEISKINPYYFTDGTTNAFAFATAVDYSDYTYWHVGTNKPAVIVTSSDVKITRYVETSTYIDFEWSCSQPLATQFVLLTKEATDTVWSQVVTTQNKSYRVTGFLVGKSRDWKITSTYMEDGE